jgi:hypothetical protein
MKFRENSSTTEKVMASILYFVLTIVTLAMLISAIMVCYNLFLAIWVDIKAFGTAIKWMLTWFLTTVIGVVINYVIVVADLDIIETD